MGEGKTSAHEIVCHAPISWRVDHPRRTRWAAAATAPRRRRSDARMVPEPPWISPKLTVASAPSAAVTQKRRGGCSRRARPRPVQARAAVRSSPRRGSPTPSTARTSSSSGNRAPRRPRPRRWRHCAGEGTGVRVAVSTRAASTGGEHRTSGADEHRRHRVILDGDAGQRHGEGEAGGPDETPLESAPA